MALWSPEISEISLHLWTPVAAAWWEWVTPPPYYPDLQIYILDAALPVYVVWNHVDIDKLTSYHCKWRNVFSSQSR